MEYPEYQAHFREMLRKEPAARGRVLDVGCDEGQTERFNFLNETAIQVDGVDPSDAVFRHPMLTCRWKGTLESSPIPTCAYDLAFAYNVVEHVTRPRDFMRSVARILKPGGVFWALTPSAYHVFVIMAWSAESLGLKPLLARSRPAVNEYASPYLLNSPIAVRKAIAGQGFRKAEFFYHKADTWYEGYLPRWTWPAARVYNRLSQRVEHLQQVFIMRLQKE